MHKSGHIKTQAEIETIAEGGAILRRILTELAHTAKPGVSTKALSDYAEQHMVKAGGRPSFIGYGPKKNPFPAGLCTSVNDVVVHGIPSKHDILKAADIVGLDIGMEYKGLYTDTAITVEVGSTDAVAHRLVTTARRCLEEALKQARPGNKIGDISSTIQRVAEQEGFSVVRDLVGHGVGYAVHEDPAVPCYGKAGTGIALEEGMVLAIEPMVCEKKHHVYFDQDGWTIRTEDGARAAHFEHTIAITKQGSRILT